MSLKLQDDHFCYVCGKDNPAGLRLDFEHPKKGVLRAVAVFNREHQGYRGIVHGGILSMVLDEMMVNLAWKEGLPVVTGEITVRLKKPAPTGERIFFEGRIEREDRRLVYASAKALNAQDEVLATATAVCVKIRKS